MFESSSKGQKTNSTKIPKPMKATFSIILTVLGLQYGLLFANGTSAQAIFSEALTYPLYEAVPSTLVSDFNAEELKVLAPVLPVEADFSDNDLVTLSSSSPASPTTLAPCTPAEADFYDSDADNLNTLLPYLAPIVPGEADFQDTDTVVGRDSSALAPVSPSEATFDDIV
jgi:hypothetical protein